MRLTDSRRRQPAIAATLVLVALLLVMATSAEARVFGRLVPRSGAMLGVYVPDDGTRHQTSIGSFEHRIGRQMAIDHRFYAWRTPFPMATDRASVRKGRTVFITWRPDTTSLRAIASGREDRLIAARARAIGRLHAPVMIAFAHEMNGGWYAWGHQPAVFVKAWRRLVNVARRNGGERIVWVWSPNWKSVPGGSWNAIQRYYPGDRFVDWVAISAYNRGPYSETKRWRQLREMVQPVYRLYGNRKPMMIRETGSVEAGGSKAKWIYTAARDLRSRFPDVAAFVWFEARANGNDWRVETSRSALAAFKNVAHSPWFAPR